MLKNTKIQFSICFGVLALVFAFLIVGLANLTLSQGELLAQESETKKVRTLTVKGTRGQITDVTGIPLAYNQKSYNVEIVKDPSRTTSTDKSYFTDVIDRTIKIVEENGGTTIDTFAIVRDADGTFRFSFGDVQEDVAKTREENWRKNMFVSTTSTPDVLYRDLRARYRIPEEYTYEQARKLLSVWQEVQLSSYRAYVPVQIATDVSTETVAKLEANAHILDGIQVAEGSTRIYPKDNVAAHIIGYIGKMTDAEEIKEMQKLGYGPNDLIGITGIESTMEEHLTGNSTQKQGSRTVEVNNQGKVIQEITATPPISGDNVMLTLDLQMQIKLEEALRKNIDEIYQSQLKKYYEKQEEYDQKIIETKRSGDNPLDKVKLAKSGAAVVMDVKTGKVLAMTSQPSYDLNVFTGGISDANFKMLREDKAAPLFNNAIASKGTPGSIFKMVTGMGGLMEGAVTLNTRIDDEGEYREGLREGARGPACWVKPYFEEHAQQNIVDALKNSCNYYFFKTATLMGIDKLSEWSDRFGLTARSGIELPGETVGHIGTQKTLYDATLPLNKQSTSKPLLKKAELISILKECGDARNVEYEDEQLSDASERLIELVGMNTKEMGPQIRSVLSEVLDIPETMTRTRGWDNVINSALLELLWNPTETANSGTGTGITLISPIATARYISAVANRGTVYEAQIVDSITDASGNVIEKKEPVVFNQIDAPKEYWDAIHEGMREVVSAEDGTAAKTFRDWKYKDQIGGKTGTGVVSTIDLESNAWFVAYAPFEDPEIAVVVYIPNGSSGASAIPTARDIIEYYLDGKTEKEPAELPTYDTLVP